MYNFFVCEGNFLSQYLENKRLGIRFDIDRNYDSSVLLELYGDKAVINIYGMLVPSEDVFGRYYGYSFTTYQGILQAVKDVSSNEQIKEVTLSINSPGGYVSSAISDVWKAIRNLSQTKKVTAVNKDMIASAAYWLASAANEIQSTDLAYQGSIGVVAGFTDYTEADKKYGIREVTVLSRNAPNKRLETSDPKLVKQIQKRLDEIEAVFISQVSEGRNVSVSHVEQNFGRGALLNTNEAISAGMIDTINGKPNSSAHLVTNYHQIMNKRICTVEDLNAHFEARQAMRDHLCGASYKPKPNNSIYKTKPPVNNGEWDGKIRNMHDLERALDKRKERAC